MKQSRGQYGGYFRHSLGLDRVDPGEGLWQKGEMLRLVCIVGLFLSLSDSLWGAPDYSREISYILKTRASYEAAAGQYLSEIRSLRADWNELNQLLQLLNQRYGSVDFQPDANEASFGFQLGLNSARFAFLRSLQSLNRARFGQLIVDITEKAKRLNSQKLIDAQVEFDLEYSGLSDKLIQLDQKLAEAETTNEQVYQQWLVGQQEEDLIRLWTKVSDRTQRATVSMVEASLEAAFSQIEAKFDEALFTDDVEKAESLLNYFEWQSLMAYQYYFENLFSEEGTKSFTEFAKKQLKRSDEMKARLLRLKNILNQPQNKGAALPRGASFHGFIVPALMSSVVALSFDPPDRGGDAGENTGSGGESSEPSDEHSASNDGNSEENYRDDAREYLDGMLIDRDPEVRVVMMLELPEIDVMAEDPGVNNSNERGPVDFRIDNEGKPDRHFNDKASLPSLPEAFRQGRDQSQSFFDQHFGNGDQNTNYYNELIEQLGDFKAKVQLAVEKTEKTDGKRALQEVVAQLQGFEDSIDHFVYSTSSEAKALSELLDRSSETLNQLVSSENQMTAKLAEMQKRLTFTAKHGAEKPSIGPGPSQKEIQQSEKLRQQALNQMQRSLGFGSEIALVSMGAAFESIAITAPLAVCQEGERVMQLFDAASLGTEFLERTVELINNERGESDEIVISWSDAEKGIGVSMSGAGLESEEIERERLLQHLYAIQKYAAAKGINTPKVDLLVKDLELKTKRP